MPRTYSAGERIIKQGDVADGMYFVEDGNVRITILDDNGQEVEINRIGKGGYFGELALVTHRPRAASAFAVEDIKLACKLKSFVAALNIFYFWKSGHLTVTIIECFNNNQNIYRRRKFDSINY